MSCPRDRAQLCRACLLAIAMAAPATAWAQGGAYANVSISATQMYDGNLFATPASGGLAEDFISRFGPLFEAGYTSVPFKLSGHYQIEAEQYVRHTELNGAVARQLAGLTVDYRPAPRLGFNVDATYTRTPTPSEFNVDSRLAVGRARAERGAMSSAATYEWDPTTKSTVAYTLTHDGLAGGVTTVTQHFRIAVERRTGLRNAYRVDGQFLHFGFSEGTSVRSSVVTGAWSHEFTPRTGFEISAGPRVTQGAIRAEASAVLRHRLARGEFSASYGRTELTAIGEAGTFQVTRMAVSAALRPRRRLTLTGTPSVVTTVQNGTDVKIYTLELEAARQVTRRLTLSASGRIGQQDGGFFGGPREPIPYRSLAVRLTYTPVSTNALGPDQSPN